MTTKAAILQAIRQKCLDCSCDQPSEVRECPVTSCDLWDFRFGHDPSPSTTRGFAKSPVYTEDLTGQSVRGQSGSTQQGLPGESPVCTEGFERQSHFYPHSTIQRA